MVDFESTHVWKEIATRKIILHNITLRGRKIRELLKNNRVLNRLNELINIKKRKSTHTKLIHFTYFLFAYRTTRKCNYLYNLIRKQQKFNCASIILNLKRHGTKQFKKNIKRNILIFSNLI